MPLVDMPLRELLAYEGVNPKPADFDHYWNRAKTEIEAIDPEVTLVEAPFQCSFANCYHFYYRSAGNAKIHAKYLQPKTAEKTPAVFMFHGYGGRSAEWSSLLNYVAAGFSVFYMDVRGQGGASEDPGGVRGNTYRGHIIRGLDAGPDSLFYRSVFLDTVQLVRAAKTLPHIDETRLMATGWSQGGALTLACAALVPEIKRLAPVYPFLSDYKRVWQMDLAIRSYKELADYFRSYDPQHKRHGEIFELLGYIDVQHLADRIQGDVLMGVGLMDTECPPSTQFAAYNKIKAKKSYELYPDFGHEHLPGMNDHIFRFFTG